MGAGCPSRGDCWRWNRGTDRDRQRLIEIALNLYESLRIFNEIPGDLHVILLDELEFVDVYDAQVGQSEFRNHG
jgi:hypothetical protein